MPPYNANGSTSHNAPRPNASSRGGPIRILFFADSHLGFDLPSKPKVVRRRRGHDFFANFELVLRAAVEGDIDLVVHGGDVFYRSRVAPELVQRVFLGLKRVADRGVPIYLVPGNHERSRIPYPMLAEHPCIHIFDRPRTFVAEIDGRALALSGFPYHRRDVRADFRALLDEARSGFTAADIHLLCVHHCFEGATVGPQNYTFRYASDVIALDDVPWEFAAVLTGHIHRHQVLTTDLRGRELATPVFYPGSIERTAFAEMSETKGYLTLDVEANRVASWKFHELPARPMLVERLNAVGQSEDAMEIALRAIIDRAPIDAILQVRIEGTLDDGAREVLRAHNVRTMTPSTMNVDVVVPDDRDHRNEP